MRIRGYAPAAARASAVVANSMHPSALGRGASMGRAFVFARAFGLRWRRVGLQVGAVNHQVCVFLDLGRILNDGHLHLDPRNFAGYELHAHVALTLND